MSALTAARPLRLEAWNRKSFTLRIGNVAFKGGMAAYDRSLGQVVPVQTGAGSADLFSLGLFAEDVDATSASKPVVVELKREVWVIWMKNDGTNPVTVNDIGNPVYGVDDQTVSKDSATSTRSVVGIAWAVDATLGVAVEFT